MKIQEKLPEAPHELKKIILNLQQELANEKLKNAYLLEQFRLAKQIRFAPHSEKNIYQADLFDEAGIELETEEEITDEKNTIEIKSHQRKKYPVRKPLPAELPRE